MSRKNQAYLFIIQKSHGIKLIYIGKRLPNKDGGSDVFRSSEGSSWNTVLSLIISTWNLIVDTLFAQSTYVYFTVSVQKEKGRQKPNFYEALRRKIQ